MNIEQHDAAAQDKLRDARDAMQRAIEHAEKAGWGSVINAMREAAAEIRFIIGEVS